MSSMCVYSKGYYEMKPMSWKSQYTHEMCADKMPKKSIKKWKKSERQKAKKQIKKEL